MKTFMEYERPSVSTDVVLFRIIDKDNGKRKEADKVLQVCLYKRNEDPYNGKWSLPGGMVSIDKTMEETIKEKTQEKTGYSNFYYEQLYTFDQLHRDTRWRVISTAFIGIVKKNIAVCRKDALGAKAFQSDWFTIQDGVLTAETSNETISLDDLAFDHKLIINKALERMRGKIFYSNIGFEFLDKQFTVSELRKTFEIILGKNIDNFRRTVKNKIVATGNSVTDVAHRPATLYERRNDNA